MMRTFNLAVLILFLSQHLPAQGNKDAFDVQTEIEKGTIEGNYDTKTNIQSYLGVPFAKPPVNELRWKPPQPLEKWEGVKETKTFGPRPMQKLIYDDMNSRSDGVSEDCLYLNVWTPAKRNTKDLPVMVYFYGGGFVAGDGSEPRYDGESMAQKGIVVVTANYRLNVFGFLAHPELSEESPYGASGNYGLLDQLAALKWVRKNIAAFGGDSEHITIAGESAGSISVSLHMASPLSKDLISGAIGESGAGINPTMPPAPLERAEKTGEEFVNSAGFNSIAELRKAPPRVIYEIYNEAKRFRFPLVLDDHFLPKSLPEIFEAKEQAHVPLLLGWNSAEIPGTAFMQGKPYTEENYFERVKEVYPEKYTRVLELYPYGSEKEIELSATALASDRFIAYSTWKWFDLHRKNSEQPVYRYLYSKIRPPMANQPNDKDQNEERPEPIGAPHACEIEYCMGNLHLIKDFAWTKEDYMVSETMQNYFANFIKNGDPNVNELPEWPRVGSNDLAPEIMVIDTESKAVQADNDDRYRFLDEQYGNK